MLALAVGAVLLTAAAMQAALAGPSAPPPGLADELAATTWAIHVPAGWLAAAAPPLRAGDSIDLLGIRSSDKPYVVPIVYGVTVISASERGVVLQVDDIDATAIASARSSGLLLIALLRSAR